MFIERIRLSIDGVMEVSRLKVGINLSPLLRRDVSDSERMWSLKFTIELQVFAVFMHFCGNKRCMVKEDMCIYN